MSDDDPSNRKPGSVASSDEQFVTSSEPYPEDLSFDDIVRSLSHPIRRAVLYHLCDQLEATIEDLTAVVAERSRPPLPPEPSSDHQERVRVSLAHVHLPKLAAAGWVVYDRTSRTARYAPRSDRFDRLLIEIDRLEGVLDE